jgi:hypothetical protein
LKVWLSNSTYSGRIPVTLLQAQLRKAIEIVEYLIGRSRLWKRAAKYWRDSYYESEAWSTRRLELLTDCVELLYVIRDHYAVNEITTGEMIERIEKELADADN